MTAALVHITDAQRVALRARLLARAHVLFEEIDTGSRPENLRQEAFDATSIEEAGVRVGAVQRDADELRAIQQALARLDAGTYGLCVECGCALPYVRLDAVPEAQRCVHCESRSERGKPAPASL
ncbi:MAG TPA: TraR/DksA C4-type zinc finger protein [Usitatibacter sp.]|jgi:DnaK suppressor protein|nr:TraR/DksA C4-type zinc finger protein [Usitatibacter sp.]